MLLRFIEDLGESGENLFKCQDGDPGGTGTVWGGSLPTRGYKGAMLFGSPERYFKTSKQHPLLALGYGSKRKPLLLGRAGSGRVYFSFYQWVGFNDIMGARCGLCRKVSGFCLTSSVVKRSF